MSTNQVTTIRSTSTSSSSSTQPTSSFSASSTSRPARIQISHSKLKQLRDFAESNNQPGGGTYNIWYNKLSGGDTQQDRGRNLIKADTRCDLAKDQGWTRANRGGKKVTTDGNSGDYCCLFFARGHCPNGPDCTFLHTLPPSNLLPSLSTDIFGRTKHGDYRDDMGGVGSLQRVNRTLYVGRIVEEPRISSGGGGYNSSAGTTHAQWRDGGRTTKGGGNVNDLKRKSKGKNKEKESADPTEEVLKKHFQEWGEIDKIRVLTGRSCAFVTYRSESSAQFAKEAMTCQSLDHNEILNVRWSTEDPNPGAIKREREAMIRDGKSRIEETLSQDQLEAGRKLRELEDQDEGQREDQDQNGDGDGTRKRLKFDGNEDEVEDEELKRLIEENKRGWKDIEREEDERIERERQRQTDIELQEARQRESIIQSSGGLLSNDALIGLKSLGAIRKVAKVGEQPKGKGNGAGTGLMALSGYGSESEED